MATIEGTAERDVILTTLEDDIVAAGDGWDQIYASIGSDTIDGGEGSDTLYFNTAIRSLFPDPATGPQRFVVSADSVARGDGGTTFFRNVESISINDVGNGDFDVTVDARSTALRVTALLGNGDNRVMIADGGSFSRLGGGRNIVTAGAGDDMVELVTGGGARNVVDLGAGRDEVVFNLRDTPGPVPRRVVATIDQAGVQAAGAIDAAVSGAETIAIYGHRDTVYRIDARGFDGRVELSGGNGRDTLFASDRAGTGAVSPANILNGQGGADVMVGGRGADTFYVDDPGDVVRDRGGTRGDHDQVVSYIDYRLPNNIEDLELFDTALYFHPNPPLPRTGHGNRLDNSIAGQSGGDRLFGHGGADVISGQRGEDRIVGGGGKDLMYGGDDADTFVFYEGDTRAALRAADRIGDFSQVHGDRIDLSAIDADSATSGDETLTFVGDRAFGGAAGELRHFVRDGSTWVQGDTNGDSRADFTIRLDREIALTASDFIL